MSTIRLLRPVGALRNGDILMKMLIAAAALAAVIALPAFAASGQAPGKTHAAKQTVKKVKIARAAKRLRRPHVQYIPAGPQPFSPFVHRPEYDVYVDGEIAGSDPDPLVRDQLRREWRCFKSTHC
jgi:hypothetical protein